MPADTSVRPLVLVLTLEIAMIELTPRILANQMADVRDYYANLGWPKLSCSIGFDSQLGVVKAASDDGAIAYQWDDAGFIHRNSLGCPSKLIEFVDIDIAGSIKAHNQRVLDAKLLKSA